MSVPTRKHSNGRYTAAFRNHVVRWVVAQVGRTAGEAASRWEVDDGSVRRWMRQAGVKAVPEIVLRVSGEGAPQAETGGAPASRVSRKPPGGRYRAPVDDMGQEDRDRVVNTARDMAVAVELGAAAMREDMERQTLKRQEAIIKGKEPAAITVSKDSAQGMLHLYRTLGLAVDTFPGLMKVAGIEEQSTKAGRDLDGVMKALGLAGEPGEAK